MDGDSIGLMDGRVTCSCWQIEGGDTYDNKLLDSYLVLIERLSVRIGRRSMPLDRLQDVHHTKQIKPDAYKVRWWTTW
jgi:hypothetical protein